MIALIRDGVGARGGGGGKCAGGGQMLAVVSDRGWVGYHMS